MSSDPSSVSVPVAILLAMIPAAVAAVAQLATTIVKERSSHALEAKKLRNDFIRDRQRVLSELKFELRNQQASWRNLDHERFAEGEDDGEFISSTLMRLDEFDAFHQMVVDHLSYLEVNYYKQLLKAFDLYYRALEPVRFYWQNFNASKPTWQDAYRIYKAVDHILSLTEGILKLTQEHTLAEYGNRQPSWDYCERVRARYMSAPHAVIGDLDD